MVELELLNMRIILAIFIVFISAAVLASEGEQKGSLYISKIDPNVSWEGNPTGATPDSVFAIVLDGKIKVQISKNNDAKIENLELGKKHSVAIYLETRKVESFYFRFEKFRCDKLWLYYKEMYGTWVLRESSFSCKRE